MASQDAIAQLQQNSWRTLSQEKAINNDIMEMDVRRSQKLEKLAGLGSKAATQLIQTHHKMRMSNLQSEAYNDFYENYYEDYLNTDEAKEASGILLDTNESSSILHNNLGMARSKGLSGDMTTKIAEKHPMYAYTVAKLHLGQLAGRFEGYIGSEMAKSEEWVTLPNVMDPNTGLAKQFQIKNAKTLQEKMAAHRYLRGKFFTQPSALAPNGIGAFGKAFLALPADQGGSNFLGSISSAENGKDGMFAKYALEADIHASGERLAMHALALSTNPNALTMQAFLDANLVARTKNGRITAEKAWKNVDSAIEGLIKSGQLTYSDLVKIGTSIVPGSKSAKYPNGLTYAQKWPQRFGFVGDGRPKDGDGLYMRTWSESVTRNATQDLKLKKAQFPKDFEDAKEAIGAAASKNEAYEVIGDLKQVYGSDEDFDYGSLFTLIEDGALTFEDVPNETKVLLKRIDEGLPLTGINIVVSDAAKTNPIISAAIEAEGKLKGTDEYKEGMKMVEKSIPNHTFNLLSGKTTWKEGTGSSDEKMVLQELREMYFQKVRSGKVSPLDAAIAVNEHYVLNGGGELNVTKEVLAEGVDTPYGPMQSNKYSMTDKQGISVLVNGEDSKVRQGAYKTPIDASVLAFNRPIDFGIKGQLGANPLETLSQRGADGLPTYRGIAGENAENTNYNEILWNTRIVDNKLIDHAVAAGVSLTDVIEARLQAWGHPPLSDEVKNLLGSDLVKYLPGGIQNRLFGDDDGFYNPYQVTHQIASQAKSPTAIAETLGFEELTLGADAYKGVEPNAAAAFFLSSFGQNAFKDLSGAGAGYEWSEYFSDKFTNDWDFKEALEKDDEYNWQLYGLSGDKTLLNRLLLDSLKANIT